MMLARFNSVIGRHTPRWRDDKLYIVSCWHGDSEDQRMNKYYGKITLAFHKDGKRILIKGEIKVDYHTSHQGLFVDWYFVPRASHKARLHDTIDRGNH